MLINKVIKYSHLLDKVLYYLLGPIQKVQLICTQHLWTTLKLDYPEFEYHEAIQKF